MARECGGGTRVALVSGDGVCAVEQCKKIGQQIDQHSDRVRVRMARSLSGGRGKIVSTENATRAIRQRLARIFPLSIQ